MFVTDETRNWEVEKVAELISRSLTGQLSPFMLVKAYSVTFTALRMPKVTVHYLEAGFWTFKMFTSKTV